MNLTDFGTERFPLRPSHLGKVVRCPMQGVLTYTHPDTGDDLGGAAAQTGNLVHIGVAEYHRTGSVQSGAAAMAAALPIFPGGDEVDATKHYLAYCADPRNQEAQVVAIEHPVTLVLPPHSSDPTGQSIHIKGTLDQIRRLPDGRLVVDDVKTGKPSALEMVHNYAYQLSAYVLAARASGFPTTEPGRIIRTYGYRSRTAVGPSPEGVFVPLNWSVDDCVELMGNVRLRVAEIRRGELTYGPGEACLWCELGGLASCIPQSKLRLNLL